MASEAQMVIQEKRGLIHQLDNPTLVVLYGDDGMARSVGVTMGMMLKHDRRKCLIQEVEVLHHMGPRLAPNEDVLGHITESLEDGSIRVVIIGMGCVMVYDQKLSYVFSMLN
jgi:hypothetical protein